MQVIEFETEKASKYVKQALEGYLNDPADSDYQKGFLAALLVVYREGLGKGVGDDRLALLDEQVKS